MPHEITNRTISGFLDDMMTEADDARQEFQRLRMEMYFDAFTDAVKELLESQFDPENAKILRPLLSDSYNPFKKIHNLKAALYKEPALREWIVGETPNEKFDDLMANSNIDQSSVTLDKFVNVNNIAFMRIVARHGRLEYDPIPPELIWVEQDEQDPLRFNAIAHKILINGSRGTHKVLHHVWTNGKSSMDEDGRAHYWIFETKDVMDGNQPVTAYVPMEQKDNPENLNPYIDPEDGSGVIPYQEFRVINTDDFWNETLNTDLYNFTLQYNVLMTHLNHLLTISGYNQIAITGEIDASALHGQKTDPTAIINVKPMAGETASVQALNFTKDPQAVLKTIQNMLAVVADIHGVSFGTENTGQRQTAEALTINRSSLIEMRQERIPLYRESEREMAWKSVIIANESLNAGIDIKGEFRIDFAEPQVIQTPKERAEADLIKLNNNIISVIDLIMQENPDIKTREEAIIQLEQNIEENGMRPSTGSAVESEAEMNNLFEPGDDT